MQAHAEPGPMVPRPFRVTGRRRETADTVTLALEPEDGPGIRFLPGQFDMLYAFGVGESAISFSGADGDAVLHTVRAVGAVTRALCASEPGDAVGVRGPFGTDWGLDAAEGRDVVVVAGGIGLAPLRPAVRHLLERRDRFGRVSVLVGARAHDQLLYEQELAAWREQVDVEVTLDTARPGWRGHVGLVTELIPGAQVDPADAVALVCGPEAMMRFVARALIDRGLDPGRVMVSMERNMRCAVGHCGHCQFGPEFVCMDGPVFPHDRVARLLAIQEV
jgi:NAD(P)H-flavin reductase